MSTDTPGLVISDLTAGYDQSQVLDQLSLAVPLGSACLLTGRNGIGKSTLIKSIMGLTTRHGGHVQWQEKVLYQSQKPLVALDTTGIAQTGLGYVPEERRIFSSLTVRENLEAGTKNGPGRAWSLEQILELLPPLKPLLSRQGGLLSGGEQQMLSLARCLMGAPSLLLLDEPSEGLAPILLEHLSAAIAKLRQDQSDAAPLTLLIAEQNWQFAASFTDRVVVLDQGRIQHDASLQDFAQDQATQDRLLGAQ